MAILLLIKDTPRPPYQYVDDVVEVYDDTHIFTDTEKIQFGFLTVMGSRVDVDRAFTNRYPDIDEAYYVNGKYQRGIVAGAPTIRIWHQKGSQNWYRLVNCPKFLRNVSSLTNQDRQDLETIDVNNGQITPIINKMIYNLALDPLNTDEIEDLRGFTNGRLD